MGGPGRPGPLLLSVPAVADAPDVGRELVGVVGVWCRVASLHAFRQSADVVDRIASKAFGHGLGTDWARLERPLGEQTEQA
jgi:hypothetical protein